MGHLFIVHGDLRKLCCDAWLMPCGEESVPNRTWLEWPAGVGRRISWTPPPPGWHPERLRVHKLSGWPSEYPQPYLVNVGADKLRQPTAARNAAAFSLALIGRSKPKQAEIRKLGPGRSNTYIGAVGNGANANIAAMGDNAHGRITIDYRK